MKHTYTIMFPVFLCLAGSVAMADCEVYEKLDNQQVIELTKDLKDESAEPIMRRSAYNTLSCSDDDFVRQQAIIDGLNSDSEALRNTLMRDVLFKRINLMLEPLNVEEMTKEQIDWAKDNPSVVLTFTFSDPQNSCIGLAYNDCRNDYVLDTTGSSFSFHDARKGSGEMTLKADGIFEGFFVPVKSEGLRIPIKARLR